MAHIIDFPLRSTTLVFVTLLVSACSGSSDSASIGQGNTNTADSAIAQSESIDTDTTPATSTTAETTSITNADSNEIEPNIAGDDSDNSILSATRVTFDITVPVYVSDALQVRLVWGELETVAAWVVDETWTISEELPTNTLNPLVVTFSDANGAITLGSIETVFRTGESASETLKIPASQFDTDRWDTDGDGISNLSESISGTNPSGQDIPAPFRASLELISDKTFRFTWQSSDNAQYFRVIENADGASGFSSVSERIDSSELSFDHRVALFNRTNANYLVQACNNLNTCTNSNDITISGTLESAIGYVKASNSEAHERFGSLIELSEDGHTMAVTEIGSDLYVFERINGNWLEQEILKIPRDLNPFPQFSMSANGNTIAVQGGESISLFERIGGVWDQTFIPVPFDFASTNSGSQPRSGSIDLSSDGNTLAFTPTHGPRSDLSTDIVYVYFREPQGWQLQTSLSVSSTQASTVGTEGFDGLGFGQSLSLSSDGNRLVVAYPGEAISATNINQAINNSDESGSTDLRVGAVYVYLRTNSTWQEEARLTALSLDDFNVFANDVKISADGNTIAVGSPENRSVSRRRIDTVHVFALINDVWQLQTILSASNLSEIDSVNSGFGTPVSISDDGNTIAVGARSERSTARGVNGNQFDTETSNAGAAYVFVRNDSIWQQRAYVKSSNTSTNSELCPFTIFTDGELRETSSFGDQFGMAVSLSGDGQTLAVGAIGECSAATGINGDQTDNSKYQAGAVYLY